MVFFLDPLVRRLLRGECHDSLHVDTRQVDVVGRQLAGLDQLLDLRDRHPSGHRAQRVEVAGGVTEDEVAVAVTTPGADQPEVGHDGPLQDERARPFGGVELARVLWRAGHGHVPPVVIAPWQTTVRDLGADPGRGVEGGNPGTAGSQPLGQRALRRQLHLELPAQVLPLELLVLTDV